MSCRPGRSRSPLNKNESVKSGRRVSEGSQRGRRGLEPIRQIADPVERYVRAIWHMVWDPHPPTLAEPIGADLRALRLSRHFPGIHVNDQQIVRWFTERATGDGNDSVRRCSCVVVRAERTLGRGKAYSDLSGPTVIFRGYKAVRDALVPAWGVKGREHPAYLVGDSVYRARLLLDTPFREDYDGRVLEVELPRPRERGLSFDERLTIGGYVLPSVPPNG